MGSNTLQASTARGAIPGLGVFVYLLLGALTRPLRKCIPVANPKDSLQLPARVFGREFSPESLLGGKVALCTEWLSGGVLLSVLAGRSNRSSTVVLSPRAGVKG